MIRWIHMAVLEETPVHCWLWKQRQNSCKMVHAVINKANSSGEPCQRSSSEDHQMARELTSLRGITRSFVHCAFSKWWCDDPFLSLTLLHEHRFVAHSHPCMHPCPLIPSLHSVSSIWKNNATEPTRRSKVTKKEKPNGRTLEHTALNSSSA